MNPEQETRPEFYTPEQIAANHRETMENMLKDNEQIRGADSPPPDPETAAKITGARLDVATAPEQKLAQPAAPPAPDRFATIAVQPPQPPTLLQRALNFIGLGKKSDQGPAKEN